MYGNNVVSSSDYVGHQFSELALQFGELMPTNLLLFFYIYTDALN